MKKVLFYSLLAYVLTVNVACGEMLKDQVDHYVQPEMAPYLKEFLDDASSRGIIVDVSDLVITVENIPRAGRIGECEISWRKNLMGETIYQKRIRIQASYYEEVKESRPDLIRAVVYHEMGHCYLSRNHDNRVGIVVTNNGRYYNTAALSVMHGYTITYLPAPVLNEYWGYYLDELFGQSKVPFSGNLVGQVREIQVSKANDHEHQDCDDFKIIEINDDKTN